MKSTSFPRMSMLILLFEQSRTCSALRGWGAGYQTIEVRGSKLENGSQAKPGSYI